MPLSSNRITQFWHDLKRRKVIKVIAMYAATAFIIIEAADIMFPRFGLPDWSVTLVIVLLAVGFPIAIILSWIFDVTPEGIKKTESIEAVSEQEPPPTPAKRRLKTSDVIIAVLFVIVCVLLYPKIFNREKFEPVMDEEGRLAIAILPFKNISPDSSNQYLLDGIMEAVLNYMTKVENVRVIASTSVEQYRGTVKSISEIGSELNVNYILEGSGQKYDDNFRLTTRLSDVKSSTLIWSNPYNREINDILNLQSEVANKIATELKLELTVEDRKNLNSKPTFSDKAYENFLKAEMVKMFDPLKAIELLEEAIEIDPQFVDAYVRLSGIQMTRTSAGIGQISSDEALKLAIPPLNKALEIAPDHYYALGHLGMIKYWLEWDFKGAEREFLKSYEVSGIPLNIYVSLLIQNRRYEEALEVALKVKDFDPLNAYYVTGLSYLFLGEYDKAIDTFNEQKELFETKGGLWIGRTYMAMNDYDQALSNFEYLIDKRSPFMLSDLAICYNILGKREAANEILNELIERYNEGEHGSIAFMVGKIYSGIGEVESALEWLEKSYQDHELEMIWLYADPAFESLQDNEQYIDLLKRVGFDV